MDISALLAKYLRLSPLQRTELVAANSYFFTADVIEALDDAYDTLLQTQRQAEEICSVIENVVDGIDIPSAPRLTEIERAELVITQERLIERFAKKMAELLSKNTLPVPCFQGANTLQTENVFGSGLWHQQQHVVMRILSFLPVECTLGVAENVCGLWRDWLYLSDDSAFFWAECVQREFPETLQALQRLGNYDIFENDWRSIAMVCCANED